MANLAFIRSATCFDCWDYYERKTDVWVFGDVDGYDWLLEKFLEATKATENIHLTLLQKQATSMRAVILPAKPGVAQNPRIKIIERFISDHGNPNMELVFFGNEMGYQYLRDKIAKVIKNNVGKPSEHIHLDDLVDPYVIPRSVSLNLRGPIEKWERQNFGEYANLVYSTGEDFLPSHLDYRLRQEEQYEEITADESDFLKL